MYMVGIPDDQMEPAAKRLVSSGAFKQHGDEICERVSGHTMLNL